MRPALISCVALVLCSAAASYAKLPPPTEQELAQAIASRAKAAELSKKEAAALAKAQDRVVEHYKRSKGGVPVAKSAGKPVAKKRSGNVERITCRTGSEDRHARIGIEVVDRKIISFAYYSKWKPRTCSIDAARNSAYSRWEDNGNTSKVVLTDEKGILLIHRSGSAYRFVFRNVDRERYCGMEGKINGTLTVTRGKSQCLLEGVMDGHSG